MKISMLLVSTDDSDFDFARPTHPQMRRIDPAFMLSVVLK